jgi:predicted permease
MNTFRQWLERFRATFSSRSLDDRADEEMRLHLDLETEAAIRQGLSPEEARRRSRLRHGDALSAREAVRDQRGLPWLEDAVSDLRISARGLVRQRGFTAIALTALTLAVAINTVIFALVDGVLLQPLPYHEPERLVRVFESGEQYPKFPVSIGQFHEIVRQSQTLESIALYGRGDMQLMHEGRPENLTGVTVSDQFFPTLGVQPVLGRNFQESEMQGSSRLVILSHSLWRNRFENDPNIVGSTIRLNREPWTVIGVLPDGFEHIGGTYRSPLQGETVALWRPADLTIRGEGAYGSHYMNSIARLKRGATIAQAEQELDGLVQEVEKQHPRTHSGWQAAVSPLSEEVVGSSRQTVLLLSASGGIVLLIACANIAGLCIARGLARRREAAIRQALGARAWRLVRALVSENLLLGVVGGVAGLALAAALLPAFHNLLPADFPRLHAVRMSPAVGLFAVLSAVATAVVAGMLPALRQTRLHPREALQEAPRAASASQGARRLRSLLVAGEIALAALLCVATLLLVRSARLLEQRDHGFQGGHVLAFNLSPFGSAYPDNASRARLYEELIRRWSELPGVEEAGITTNVPWTGYDDNSGFAIVGRTSDEQAGGRYQAATPGYFDTLRIPILQGRNFNDRDRQDAPAVLLINESLAKRYFEGENPVGRIIDVWDARREVVGVVADIRDRPGDADAVPGYWFPQAQVSFGLVTAVLRTTGDPLAMAQPAAAVVHALDPELPVADIRTMDAIMEAALAERRFALWLFQAFAALALTLAAVGVYGLLAYLMEQRRKELGIRMALGARRGQIVGMVLRDGARLSVVGVTAGLLLVPVAGNGLAAFLYGVAPTDPVSLLAAAFVILAVGVTASFVPAWTAGRSRPMTALREE